MRGPEWYVIQVQTGRERAACRDILRVCQGDNKAVPTRGNLFSECFVPKYWTQFKLNGEWRDEERLMLPGYVIAVTSDPAGLAQALREVPGFARLLRMGETYVPLKDDEKAWMARWTSKGDRTIPMSIAHKEGDRIVVTDGPLKGQEGMIKRIKRRQSVAELEIHVGQTTIRTTVGLAVLPGKPDQ